MRTISLSQVIVHPAPQISLDVLHLEDDEAYAELVRRWITARGLTIKRVSSRSELLSYLSECSRQPRCLLMDLGLGDSRGLTLCDEIKRSPSLQQLPIIVFSGSTLSSCECMEHGVLQLVRKGADGPQELLAALTSVIAQHARSQGVIDVGDLHLNPDGREVSVGGRLVATLAPGPFSALLLLVKSMDKGATDEALYAAFLERRSYHHLADSPLTIRTIVKEYIYRLRQDLGPLGERIQRLRGEGYAYRLPEKSI